MLKRGALYVVLSFTLSSFKCASTQCTNSSIFCDGKVDCSDEENCITTSAPSFPENGCKLPPFPENGEYNVSGLEKFNPGDAVQQFTTIEFFCRSGYKLHPYKNKRLDCEFGEWGRDVPQCIQFCPTISSSESVKVICEIEQKAGEHLCEDPFESTIAGVSCQPYYERANETDPLVYITRCKDGRWDKPIDRYVCKCSQDAFGCASGQCIDGSLLCDGRPDCNDGSDETQEACRDFQCNNSKYRCAYGACIHRRGRCNYIVDCFDGSDEENCVTTTARSVSVFTCRLPDFPKNGEYSVEGLANFSPGDRVPLSTVITFSCRSGYKVYPFESTTLSCSLGLWSDTVPHCSRFCKTISSTESVKVTCEVDDNTGEEYCKDPVESTIAKFSCQPNYEEDNKTYSPVRIIRCHDGVWDRPISAYRCKCGKDAFMCASGQCIASSFLCDGEADCSDGSDETQETCRENGCKLPDFPENGEYNVSGLANFNPGETVPSSTVINFSCKNGYRVYPYENNRLFCVVGVWDKDVPHCRRVCSTVSSTESVKVICEIDDKSGENYCENPVESTVAKFSCQANYEKVNENYIIRCIHGYWDKDPHTYACKCGRDAFKCASDQCINNSFLCDGKPDCNDGTDETREACQDFHCEGSKYRCAYGACVPSTARCDNTPDCLDRSDEQNCTTVPYIPPRSMNGCELPGSPEYGEYNVSGLARFNPGDIVGSYTVITFSCKNGYRVYPYENNILVCVSGKWDKDVPHCRQICPAVPSTKSVKVACEIENSIKEKYCKDPVESTVAMFSCQMYYEKVRETDPSPYITRCKNGTWNKGTYDCVPACGRRRGKGKTNIIGGTEAQGHDFPWHVAIYNKSKEYLCGGSLIYSAGRFEIVTAAHCVADYQNGIQLPTDNYLVAAGKHYREYDDERDRESAQYLQIKSIHPYSRYKGELSQHAGDIAVIELTDEVRITSYVQPVCMNWDTHKQYTSNGGMVIGWGYTKESGDLSDVLKVLHVPILSYGDCFESVREEFKPYVTFDKLCAGYKGQGQSVCSGDSGGGLVVREGTKHYLRGIVSVSPPSQTAGYCDQDSYAGYTDLQISQYIDFLQRV